MWQNERRPAYLFPRRVFAICLLGGVGLAGKPHAGMVVGSGTGESTGSEGMWALFKNHFQPGGMDKAALAI